MGTDNYGQLGVSAAKEDVHKAIRPLDDGLVPKAFCRILPAISGDPRFVSIMHNDGAGSKAALAYAYWKGFNDLSVWAGVVQDSIVMNLDDVMCTGALGPFVLGSNIDRHSHLITAPVLEVLIQAAPEYARRMREYGIDIRMGGGETADLNDQLRTLTVNHSLYAEMRRDRVIDCSRIGKGDVIIGLASFGQARYEDVYNSGIGSNGLTLARHGVLRDHVGIRYPETFDPELGLGGANNPQGRAYRGSKDLHDKLPGTPLNFGQALLSPTRTYAPVLKEVITHIPISSIHGIIHCSGGGQKKVLNFVNGVRIIKDNLFQTPPIFQVIQEESHTSWEEMYRVFNMGHRMEIYTDEMHAETIIAMAEHFGVEARVVGRVEEHSGGLTDLVIQSENGEFVYKTN